MWRFDWLIEESLIASTALKIGCRAIALAVAGAWQQFKKAGDFDRVGSFLKGPVGRGQRGRRAFDVEYVMPA